MKKLLYLTIIFCCVLAMPVVAAMKSDPVNNNIDQNNKSNSFRPMHATNIKIAKKIPASLAAKDTKDLNLKNPDILSGQDILDRAATGVLGMPLNEGANKYAVVIGICDYPGRGMDICLSDGDSYNMVTALVKNYGYDPNNIYWFRDKGRGAEIIDGNKISYGVPTHENIRKAVMDIKYERGINADDEVVFFFSGHGTSGEVVDGTVEGEDDDENNAKDLDEGIMVYDSDKKIDGDGYSKFDFIWDGELRSWFYGFGTERIVFIFDTCLAGGMNDVVRDEKNRIYSDRLVIMSSKETQNSSVYSDGRFGEGMFSRYFVNEGMSQGFADGYNQIQLTDESVAVEEAFDYAKENIVTQNPVINDNFTNDLLLGYYSLSS